MAGTSSSSSASVSASASASSSSLSFSSPSSHTRQSPSSPCPPPTASISSLPSPSIRRLADVTSIDVKRGEFMYPLMMCDRSCRFPSVVVHYCTHLSSHLQLLISFSFWWFVSHLMRLKSTINRNRNSDMNQIDILFFQHANMIVPSSHSNNVDYIINRFLNSFFTRLVQ